MIQEHIRKGRGYSKSQQASWQKFRKIKLPALQSAKAELHRTFQASGTRQAELARRIGIPKANVDRCSDLSYQSRLELIEAALLASGKTLAIEICDAA